METVKLIEKKRDGGVLNSAEIEWLIEQYTQEKIPDYQMAALLMAIYWRGMTREETVALTLAMVRSGQQLDLHEIIPFVVDKHSSGGVGDKTTLVVQPLVAACGVPIGKMSGRGLGMSGGTLDKMESIPGWSGQMSIAQFRRQLQEIGLVLAGQSADLAPADGKLYALRDVTATVSCIPLIASSIMSKKLAAGADAIVLDVKVGRGAFMSTVAQAQLLAETMVGIGRDAGRKVVALLSDMNQPLGWTAGNALELREAISVLRGEVAPPDFWAHCLTVASHLLLLAGKAETIESAEALLIAARDSGEAFAKFRAMVVAQGGDPRYIDDTTLLPQATYITPILATQTGYVATIDVAAIGWAVVDLGGGRKTKKDQIDHAVGIELRAKVGDFCHAGTVIGAIHANSRSSSEVAQKVMAQVIDYSAEPFSPLPQFYGIVRS